MTSLAGLFVLLALAGPLPAAAAADAPVPSTDPAPGAPGVPPAPVATPRGAAGAAEGPALAEPVLPDQRGAGAQLAAVAAALGEDGPNPAAIAALVDALVAQEAALGALRDAAFSAEAREHALALDLVRRRPEITRLLAALQSLSRGPGPAPGFHPDGPLAGARAELLLRHITPGLQAAADALATQLRAVAEARAQRVDGLAQIETGLAQLAAGRDLLTDALAARGLPSSGVGLAARAIPAELALEAETLSGLADRLAALTGAAASASPDTLALRWPVAGRLRSGFDERDGAGVRRPGLLLVAAPLSLVTAPADGLVRYAGPFLDYGYVVILELRADVLVVLAGLATLEARSGETVRAGDLLGLLGGRPLSAQEFLMLEDAGNDETPAETLYIELRHGAGAVDPAPWFNG